MKKIILSLATLLSVGISNHMFAGQFIVSGGPAVMTLLSVNTIEITYRIDCNGSPQTECVRIETSPDGNRWFINQSQVNEDLPNGSTVNGVAVEELEGEGGPGRYILVIPNED